MIPELEFAEIRELKLIVGRSLIDEDVPADERARVVPTNDEVKKTLLEMMMETRREMLQFISDQDDGYSGPLEYSASEKYAPKECV